ncbi:MAG TPA: hypothetical protein VIB39_02480 [Candidatus Angelobacter sp.]|jgi:hypothetical protein
MPSALRDFLLSFCPAAVRQAFPPEHPHRTLRSATWGGLAQFFLASWAFLIQLKAYLVHRAQQIAPQVTGQGEVVQAGITAIVVLEFLLHPLSLLLLYVAIEGLLRFMTGLVSGEVLPSLFFFLAFKAAKLQHRRRERRQDAGLAPDSLEKLPDGRIRISSARAKTTWNASITIGLDGGWFEVERTEQADPPRAYVYCLHPSPPGKILRGYEEYDTASAIKIEANDPSSAQAQESVTRSESVAKK